MKLLFDHNLSYKLVARLADLFPNSEHVRNVNLHEADDRPVWEYARAHGFAIVSTKISSAELPVWGTTESGVGPSRKLHHCGHRTSFAASSYRPIAI